MFGKSMKSAALVAMLVVASSAQAQGSGTDYLPDCATSVVTIDVAGLFKSKIFQELKKQAPKIAEDIESESGGVDTVLDLPFSNISRLVLAPPQFAVFTVIKPVTAVSIKSAEKLPKDFVYEEVKVGKFTAYMDKKRFDEPGKGSVGKSFCLIADRTILASIVPDQLRKVLARNNKKPELSADFQKALEQVGAANSIAAVLDFQKSSEGELLTELIRRDDGKTFPGLADVGGKIRTLTLTINVADDTKAAMRIACQDAASAADLKKSLAAGLGNIKRLLAKNDGLTDTENAHRKTAIATLDAVKLSAEGTRVEVQLTLDAATTVQIVRAFIGFVPKNTPEK